MVPTDGLWIIILGTKGFVGLILFYVALVLPAILFVRRFPARLWGDPRLAAGSLAATFLGLYMIDCLLNGFLNIIYVTLAGGLIGLELGQLGLIAAGPRQAGTPRPRPAGRPGHRDRPARPPPPAGSCWRTAAAAWDGPSSRRGARTRRRPPGGRPSTCSTGLARGRARRPRLRRCGATAPTTWPGCGPITPTRPAATRISAVAMARGSSDECPDAAAYWNTLGVAHYRAGDDRAAVAALDRARALGGGTAFDDVFLAMAHARLGDTAEARQDLARAMLRAGARPPGPPRAGRLLRRGPLPDRRRHRGRR